MPSNAAPVTGPSPEQFAGDSPAQVSKRLFNAMRPKFFPASVLPVLAGSAWGFMIAGQFDLPIFLLALFATVCVHFGANVINDVGDESGGTDRENEERIYPYTGGSRFIQAGIMSSNAMAKLGMSLLGLAAIAGLLLLISKGIMILWFSGSDSQACSSRCSIRSAPSASPPSASASSPSAWPSVSRR
jgi:1,4-dihydroxy-2-naphthoate octaprenyltransferase